MIEFKLFIAKMKGKYINEYQLARYKEYKALKKLFVMLPSPYNLLSWDFLLFHNDDEIEIKNEKEAQILYELINNY